MVISAEELGENLDIGYRKHDREDPKIMPEEFAADHVVVVRPHHNCTFSSQIPLKACKHAYAAREHATSAQAGDWHLCL